MAFDVITLVKLAIQAISATPSVDTVYTVPAGTRTLVKDISVCNTTGGALTVRIYLVPSGGSPGTGNALYYDKSIAANDTLQWKGNAVLNAGDSIRTSASGAGLTAHISGGEAV